MCPENRGRKRSTYFYLPFLRCFCYCEYKLRPASLKSTNSHYIFIIHVSCFFRLALLLAQSDYCDLRRIEGVLTEPLRDEDHSALLSELPQRVSRVKRLDPLGRLEGLPTNAYPAGPSDTQMFHSHEYFRKILYADKIDYNSDEVLQKAIDKEFAEDDRLFPDSFVSRDNLYGLHPKSQLIQDNNDAKYNRKNNVKSGSGSNDENGDTLGEGVVGGTKKRSFQSYLSSEDFLEEASMPALPLMEYVQHMANLKLMARMTGKNGATASSNNSDSAGDTSTVRDGSDDWSSLRERFDPSALVAVAVLVEEMVFVF